MNYKKLLKSLFPCLIFILLGGIFTSCSTSDEKVKDDEPGPADWTEWVRPVDQPVFSTKHGNNHDAILFVEPESEFPYYMIVSHEKTSAHLWRTGNFSWSSSSWELVSDNYQIGGHYEYDDGVKVDSTYYIFEAGNVYTFSGNLEEASGKWKIAGNFPADKCDDIGVYYEDGLFHIFGEHGNFPNGPDGTSLAHFVSETGLGNWELVDTKSVDPNPDGSARFGVGDATIAKIEGHYYLYCDRESKGSHYKIVAWKSEDINTPFEFAGKAILPRWNEEDDWDNHRIQDADIAYIPSLNKYVMACNMKDIDGNPGDPHGIFESSHLGKNETRVVGFFYSKEIIQNK